MGIINETLQKSAKEIFFAYLARSFASNNFSEQKGKLNTIDNKVVFEDKEYASLQAVMHKVTHNEDNSLSQSERSFNILIYIDSQPMQVDFVPDKGSYQVKVNREDGTKSPLPNDVKNIFDYSLDKEDSDIVAVFENTNFRYFPNQNKLGVDIATTVDGREQMTLGGEIGSLWESQINSLGQMIRAEKPDMLIDLATGAGKSFVQAAWYMACHRAGLSTAFAVPDESLVQQLYADFNSVVPKEIAKDLTTSRILGEEEQNQHIILTHFQLLHEYWDDMKLKPNLLSTQIMIDEVHLPMREELYSKRIEYLKQKTSVSGFTATPSKRTEDLFGKPVASFSKYDKIRYGLVQQVDTKVKTLDKKSSISNLSPAHEYFKESETAIIRKGEIIPEGSDARYKLRWGVQLPLGEKALVLTDSFDIVENFSRLSSSYKSDYEKFDKNTRLKFIENHQVIMGKPNALKKDKDKKAEEQSILMKRNAFKEELAKEAGIEKDMIGSIIDIADSGTYLRYRVLHGLIENYVKAATGFSTAKLDVLRKSPEGLEWLTSSIPVADDKLNNYITKLRDNGIPDEEIASIAKIFRLLNDKFSERGVSFEEKQRFVDNWSVDLALHQDVKRNRGLWKEINAYANEHAIAISVNAKSKSGLALRSDEVIKKFLIPLGSDKPKHEHWSYSVAQIDAMFKAGLLGVYVTSEKIAGFSDPDMQHEAILIDNMVSALNNPDNAIQAFGRSRGLNFQRSPYFLGVSKRGVEFSLDFEAFEQGKEFNLLESIEKYQKQKEIGFIHSQILEDFKEVIKQHIVKGALITNEETLKYDCQLVINRHFNSLFKAHNHNYDEMKTVFTEILKKAENEAEEIIKLQSSENQQELRPVFQELFSFLIKATNYVYSKKQEIEVEANATDNVDAKIYAKIIHAYDVDSVTEKAIILGQGLVANIKVELEEAEQVAYDNIPRFLELKAKEVMVKEIKKAIKKSLINPNNSLIDEFMKDNEDRLIVAVIKDFQNHRKDTPLATTIQKAKAVYGYKFDMHEFLKSDKKFNEFLEKRAMHAKYSTDSGAGILEGSSIAFSGYMQGVALNKIIDNKKFKEFLLDSAAERVTPYLINQDMKEALGYFFADDKKLLPEDMIRMIHNIDSNFLRNMKGEDDVEKVNKLKGIFSQLSECNNQEDTKKTLKGLLKDFDNNPKKLEAAIAMNLKLIEEIKKSHYHYHEIPSKIERLGKEQEEVIAPVLKGSDDSKIWNIHDSFEMNEDNFLPFRKILFAMRTEHIINSLPLFTSHRRIQETRLFLEMSQQELELGKLERISNLSELEIKRNAEISYLSRVDQDYDYIVKAKIEAEKARFEEYIERSEVGISTPVGQAIGDKLKPAIAPAESAPRVEQFTKDISDNKGTPKLETNSSDSVWRLKKIYYSSDIIKFNEILAKHSIEGSVDMLRSRRGYRKLSLKLHPDKTGGNAEDFKFMEDLKVKLKDLDVNTVSRDIQPILHQANIGIKVADAAINAVRLVNEPTFEHAKKTALDTAYLVSMNYGMNGYSTAVSAAEALYQISQGDYKQAVTSVATSTAYMVAPIIIKHLNMPYLDLAYEVGMTAYTGYSMVRNASSLYQEYGTEESKERSAQAYSSLSQTLAKTPLQMVYDFKGDNQQQPVIMSISELHSASSKGETKKIHTLIEEGAAINVVDNQGSTPLHVAVLGKKIETIRVLVELGADVSITNNKNSTALHLATILNNNDEAIKILLKAGAQADEKDKAKYPQYFGEEAIIALFKEAINDNDIKAIKNLAKNHTQLQDKIINSNDDTILTYALAQDRLEIAGYLILKKFKEKAGSVTLRDQEVNTQTVKKLGKEVLNDKVTKQVGALGRIISGPTRATIETKKSIKGNHANIRAKTK